MSNKNKKLHILKPAAIIIIALFVFSPMAYASEITVPTVIKLVNEARKDGGVNGLQENALLDKIAQDKLDDMIQNNYFSHTSPKGVSPWFWYEKNNYDYKYAGENLAINFLVAEDQQKAWMNSPTHKKNIMNPNYKEIGVAVGAGEINGQTSIVTVQEFGTLAGAENAAIPGQNFSSENNEKILRDMATKPQVLSVKDLTGNNLKNSSSGLPENNNFLSEIWRGITDDKITWSEYSSVLAFFLLMLSLLVSSVSFLTVAGHEILAYEEIRKKALEEALELRDRHNILVSR